MKDGDNMNDDKVIENIMLFGLTRQEANLYLCLYTDGEMTGYEVSKKTGISRSNVYTGLSDLVDVGAAYVCGGSANKYRAVEIEEFCENRMRRLKEAENYLKDNLKKQANPGEGYVTISGSVNIENKIHHMLLNAKKRIYLSTSPDKLDLFATELTELCEKEIKVVLIADRLPKNISKKAEENIIFYHDIISEMPEKADQIRLIIDSAYVLTGDMKGETRDTCLYSDQPNFVAVFKEAMHNEIELIQIRRN